MIDITDRIFELEIRIAEQDRVIEDLNVAVTTQWDMLEALRRELAQVADRLGDAENRIPGEPELPPPHY